MSRKFLTDIDLSKNSLNNARIQNLSSAPSSPVAGQVYFDTTLHQFGVYNDNTTSWVYLSGGAGTGDFSSNTSSSVDGEIVLFSGTGGKTGKRATGTGIAKITSGVLGTATSGTDYAPATTGTSALKANGSGGFGTATINDLGTQTGDYSANSHKITNLTDPSSAQDAATKNYVDTTAQGLSPKQSVAAATTAALAANTYANGSSGVGATLTANANGALTVDGYSVAANDRILVQNEATASHNGIYVVTNAGSAGAAYVLTRAADFDQTAEVAGAFVFVENGTVNAASGFVCTTTGTVTFGTTSISFTQFSGAGEITAGTGLSKSGNTLSFALVSGTDYAPATSGTNILKGNGSGGFSSAKFTATIGDGSSTSIAVTHNLGTKDVIAQVRDASTDAVVECDITQTSTTQTTFVFNTAPASNAYKVVIVG